MAHGLKKALSASSPSQNLSQKCEEHLCALAERKALRPSYSLHSSFLQLPNQPASSKISANKPFCVEFRKGSSIVSAVSATETKRTNGFGGRIQMGSSSLSLYEVLGIPASASCREIKSANRRLARTCHPDAVALNRKETSANEFMKIHAAYSTLSDPDKRATYDLGLFRHQTPFDSSVKVGISLIAGNWFFRSYEKELVNRSMLVD